MTGTIRWDATVTALASISHGGETRGITTMLRREVVIQPDGTSVLVPIISGNAFRGVLRRIGEDLTRDALQYDKELPLSAVQVLRGGGSLAKVNGEPLSGSRLRTLRTLVPQIGVFGGAGGGRIFDGALQVGKVIPHCVETNHITGAHSTFTEFATSQIESFTRCDDTTDHDFPATTHTTDTQPDTTQMMFRVETFPAGTTFATWLALIRPTDLEAAFFADVLAAFAQHGQLGGRSAMGLGQVRLDAHPSAPIPHEDWRGWLADHRTEAIEALKELL